VSVWTVKLSLDMINVDIKNSTPLDTINEFITSNISEYKSLPKKKEK
jgi:hypothetical protein